MFAVGKRRGERARGTTGQLTCDWASPRLRPPCRYLTRGTNKLLSPACGRADFGFALLAIKTGSLSKSLRTTWFFSHFREREELLSERGSASLLDPSAALWDELFGEISIFKNIFFIISVFFPQYSFFFPHLPPAQPNSQLQATDSLPRPQFSLICQAVLGWINHLK